MPSQSASESTSRKHPLPVLTFRALLLATTTAVTPLTLAIQAADVRTPDEQPFGTSAVIAARFRFVSQRELRIAIEEFCQAVDVHDEESADWLAKQQVHDSTLASFLSERNRWKPQLGQDAAGESARRIFAAHAMTMLLGFNTALKQTSEYPPLVTRVLGDGAEGLFRVGHAQFEKLAEMCAELCWWFANEGYMRITLVEAPLGNCVPVAVLKELAESCGIEVQVVEWGCPRNDRNAAGRTVALSADSLAREPAIQQSELVVFIDDVLTGSRFLKMARALRKAVVNIPVACVGMQFAFDPSARFPKREQRNLDDVVTWAADIGLPFAVVEFPSIPLFRIDRKAPVVLETAMAWGDSDLVAGKRKANLIFQFIEQYEAIAAKMRERGGEYRRLLEQTIWRRDVNGQVVYCVPGLMDDVWDSASNVMDRSFFDRMRTHARAAFPDDYLGKAFSLTDAEIKKRSDWLRQELTDLAARSAEPDKVGNLARAIADLRDAGYTGGRDKPTRDHDYGQYTIPYAPALQSLNRRLVALTVALARGW